MERIEDDKNQNVNFEAREEEEIDGRLRKYIITIL